MAIDKKLRIFDAQGNEQDYDIMATDVKFLPDGKDLPTKLAEMEQEIEEAGSGDGTVTGVKVGSTTYEPTEGVVDLSTPFAGKVDKNGTDSLMTAAEHTKLQNLPTATELTTQLGQKANDNAVVKSISVNNVAQQKDGNGNVNLQVQAGEQVSVIQPDHADGTFTIHVGDTDYTINLNHTHENMAKLIVCEESDLPSTLAKDTIYAQVDDAETPTEIQSLWIAGLEFVGGGGSSDEPRLITPRSGGVIDFNGQSTTTMVVKGRNLISNLLLTIVTGDFTVTANGQSISTIAVSDVTDGASLTLTLTKGSTFNFEGGSLTIESSDLSENVSVSVIDSQASPVPSGYKKLNSVTAVDGTTINTNITAKGSSWRLKVVGVDNNKAQVLISRGISVKGAYFGILSSGKWGLTSGNEFDNQMGEEIDAVVSFTQFNTISVTISNTTLEQEQTASLGPNNVLLFNTDKYNFRGSIHEVECISGGTLHLYPAKRVSDGVVGLYDVENDVFYTGFNESNI